MQINTQVVLFLVTVLSFCLTIGTVVWRIAIAVGKMEASLERTTATMRGEFTELVTGVRHEMQLKGTILEHLDEKIVLSINGQQETFKHFTTRYKGESAALEGRLTDVEGFLVKNSRFTTRRQQS